MANLKIKIVEINGDRKGGDLSLRELNIILEQLIDQKAKVVTYGKWSFKKSELLSMDVFENNTHKLPEYIEPEAHIGEKVEKELPDEWVELFLEVADMCDGEFWKNKDDQKAVEEAYMKVLNSKLGSKVYENAARNS